MGPTHGPEVGFFVREGFDCSAPACCTRSSIVTMRPTSTPQQEVRDYVKPGTSALFMIIEHMTEDKAVAALEWYGGTVIRTSLCDEDTEKLQAVLTLATPTDA